MKKKKEVLKAADFSFTKTHKSLFVQDLDIDISNYITELIIDRYWKYKGKIPPIAFWTKEYKDKYPELCGDYVYELTQVKKLLKVFSPAVLLRFMKNNKISTLRYQTKEDSKEMVFQLFKDQISYISTLEDISKTQLEQETNKVEYISNISSKKDNLLIKGI